jgi:acyl transferase domain-containing protein
MSVAELERCDPQQRLMLMAACESIADAAEGPVAGRRVGVYMGVSERGWGDLYEKETQNYGAYSMLGTGDFALSNRVSYELDLKGPR